MNSIKFINGKDITYNYISQALQLDKFVYDELYYLDLSTCFDYFNVNPNIYFMALNADNDVIGYINFSPIEYGVYQKIRAGMTVDTVISGNEIVPYKHNQVLYGYFSSIVVHPAYRNHGLGAMLIKNVLEFLCEIARKDNIVFCEVVADAVSSEGERLLKKIGFEKEVTSNHHSEIMVFKPLSDACVKTELNEELIRTYRETKDK